MEISNETVRQLIREQLPQWAELDVTPVLEQGNDNRTFRLGEGLTVRLPSAAEVQQALGQLSNQVDVKACQAIWNEAVRTAWPTDPVWFHGDVAPGNLLTDRGRLVAVIDFGTCGVGDPACDLVITWTVFTEAERGILRDAAALTDDAWARGRGWALWKALVTLCYPASNLYPGHTALTGAAKADRSDAGLGVLERRQRVDALAHGVAELGYDGQLLAAVREGDVEGHSGGDEHTEAHHEDDREHGVSSRKVPKSLGTGGPVISNMTHRRHQSRTGKRLRRVDVATVTRAGGTAAGATASLPPGSRPASAPPAGRRRRWSCRRRRARSVPPPRSRRRIPGRGRSGR